MQRVNPKGLLREKEQALSPLDFWGSPGIRTADFTERNGDCDPECGSIVWISSVDAIGHALCMHRNRSRRLQWLNCADKILILINFSGSLRMRFILAAGQRLAAN